jgi:cytoskeletal protein CcmA (bactofilin family)
MANEQNEGTSVDNDNMDDDSAPPLKPFSRQGRQQAPSAALATPVRAFPGDATRRVAEPAQPARRHERARPGESASKQLIVGREIELSGEIRSCDRLTVEGRVEAALSDARIIEISPSGYFKGSATVDEADISGYFEGDLIARDKLTVRAQGRITGSIRYGRIVIESGGEISGDMKSLSSAEESEDNRNNPDLSSEEQ